MDLFILAVIAYLIWYARTKVYVEIGEPTTVGTEPKNYFPELANVDLDQDLVNKLNVTRQLAGVAIYITSSRAPRSTVSTHPLGQAVDISDNLEGNAISSGWRQSIINASTAAGFVRMGIYDRHIHLDVGKAPTFPQHVTWEGVSE